MLNLVNKSKILKVNFKVSNIFLNLFIFTIIVSPTIVLAQNNIGIKNPIGIESIGDLVGAVIRVVRTVALPFVVLAIMYTGFLYIAARGRPEKITTANKAFWWTLVGTLIVLSSELISALLSNTIKSMR
jgi:Type IV secretion system pilin